MSYTFPRIQQPYQLAVQSALGRNGDVRNGDVRNGDVHQSDANGSAQSAHRAYEQLRALAHLIAKELDVLKLINAVAAQIAPMLGVEEAMIGLMNEQDMLFESSYARGKMQPLNWRVELDQGVIGWVMRHRRPFAWHEADWHQADGPQRSISPELLAPHLEKFACYSLLCVPIANHQRRLLGVIVVHNGRSRRPFDRADVDLLESLAHLLTPALERAQLFGKMQRWADVLESFFAFNLALNQQLEPATLICRLVEHAALFVGAEAGRAGLCENDHMVAQQYWCHGAWQEMPGTWDRGEGMPGWVLANECTYLTNDYGADKLADPQLARFELTSALCVPIMFADQQVLGFFEIHNKSDGEPFTWSDAQFLESLANTAAVAIRNAWLLQEVETHRSQLQALTARNVSILEDERQRIARELHDESGQALIGIKLSLQVLARKIPPELADLRQEANVLRQQVNQSTAQLKQLAHNLRPPTLDQLGLQVALQQLTGEVQSRTGLTIIFTSNDMFSRLSLAVETACYRIAQEALTNVVRHARARQAEVTLHVDMTAAAPSLSLEICDDGRGFDTTIFTYSGLGMLGMRERAVTLGGELQVHSDSSGTRIRAQIPLREESIG